MKSIANSRKLNGISLVECLQHEVTEKENSRPPFSTSTIVRSPTIDQSLLAEKYSNEDFLTNNHNLVPKSLKSFFRKLRGSAPPAINTSSCSNENTNINNGNQSLQHLFSSSPADTAAEKRILVSTYSQSNPNNSKYEQSLNTVRPKKKKMIHKSTTKNYHLPTIVTTSTKESRRRVSYHRHTLDLTYNSNLNDQDSGVVRSTTSSNTRRRRTNSLCDQQINSGSIYSTFAAAATTTNNNKDSSLITSTSSSSSSNSSSNHSSMYSFSNNAADDSMLSCSFTSSCIMKRTNNTVQNLTALLCSDDDDEAIQRKLWNEDTSVCPKEEIAQWLGSKPDTRSNVLRLYMKNYDFTHQRLDEAFRNLCSKLYLKGESQQLDRIIEAFAKRYYECNPDSLLHCVDVIHAVAYSLLLLNTDLHVVESDCWQKMTRASFVKNTMETVQSLMFPDELGGGNSDHFIKQRKRRASLVSHQSSLMNDSSNSYHQRGAMKRATATPSEESSNSSSSSSGSLSPSISSSFLLEEDEDVFDDNEPIHNNSSIIFNKFDALKSNLSRKSSSLHHDNNKLTRTQKTWLADVESLLKDMYTAVKSHRIDQAAAIAPNTNDDASINNTATLYRSRTLPKSEKGSSNMKQSLRRRRGHSVIRSTDNDKNNTDMILQQQTKLLPSLPQPINSNLKQGLVMRKHVMESTDKRARHRQWQLCYLVMNETELIMYRPIHQSTMKNQDSPPAPHKSRRRKSILLWSQQQCSLQDIVSNSTMEDWQADEEQAPLGKLEMNHIYASAVPPPGWNGHRPHVFRMETADGGLWLFESIDMFAIQAWVEAANIIAARISKGPLTGAVCNIDYGWGSGTKKWNHEDSIEERYTTADNTIIPVWYPPTPCMIHSMLDMREQYHDLEAQIKDLNVQLNDHRELKLSLDKKFSASGNQHVLNSMQALTNWDRKLHYILHELIKLRCYKESLEDQIRNTTSSVSLSIV